MAATAKAEKKRRRGDSSSSSNGSSRNSNTHVRTTQRINKTTAENSKPKNNRGQKTKTITTKQ